MGNVSAVKGLHCRRAGRATQTSRTVPQEAAAWVPGVLEAGGSVSGGVGGDGMDPGSEVRLWPTQPHCPPPCLVSSVVAVI